MKMNIFYEMKSFRFTIFLHLIISYLCNNPTNSGAVSLTQATVDSTLANNELVFINFYADWCRFSNMLAPIFDEAADKVTQEFPQTGQVVMGKVDCDKESEIASRFHITKYPTLKVIRNGQPAKREYRGQRSVEAFVEFVKKQLEDPIKEFHDINDLKNLDGKKRIIIGFFDRKDVPEYTTFRRVATNLKDDCQFHVGFGEFIKDELAEFGGQAKIVYRPDDLLDEGPETYKGSMTHLTEMLLWGGKCCHPLVREITFHNGEEITEEGLPLVVLFHHPNDEDIVRRYKISCERIRAERNRVNFLHANGEVFTHPLMHLGKTSTDLPLIALDSFRHMYLFPNVSEIDDPDALERFIESLYNGRLHREFHFGPDLDHAASAEHSHTATSKPPESVFVKLQPSEHRYTLVERDEL